MRQYKSALGRVALALQKRSYGLVARAIGNKATGDKVSSATNFPTALASARPSALLAPFPNKNDTPGLPLVNASIHRLLGHGRNPKNHRQEKRGEFHGDETVDEKRAMVRLF